MTTPGGCEALVQGDIPSPCHWWEPHSLSPTSELAMCHDNPLTVNKINKSWKMPGIPNCALYGNMCEVRDAGGIALKPHKYLPVASSNNPGLKMQKTTSSFKDPWVSVASRQLPHLGGASGRGSHTGELRSNGARLSQEALTPLS